MEEQDSSRYIVIIEAFKYDNARKLEMEGNWYLVIKVKEV